MTSNAPTSLIVLVELLPFEIDLYFAPSVRIKRQLEDSNVHQWREESVVDLKTRDLVSSRVSIDMTLFSNKIESYLNDYFTKAFNGKNNSAYATFNSVVLSIMSRRLTQQSLHSNDYLTNHNPMHRELVSNSTIAIRFGGAAIFLRDGTTSIPKTTIVQSLELDALADSDRLLLYSLQNSSYASGFSTVTSLSTAIISSPIVSAPITTSKPSGINASLTIGLTVGASALTVLAFVLFFIYRRNVFFPQKEKVSDGDKDIIKSNTVDISETENSPSSAAPAMISVKLEPTFDDNISEYTESVYSAPMRKGNRSWSNPPQDMDSIRKKQDDPSFYDKIDIDSYNRYPDDEYSAGTVNDESPPKIAISDRFIPRYVDSPDDRNNSFTSDDSMDIAKQLSRAQPRQRSSGKKTRSFSEKIRGRSDSGLESTGLFPDQLVENDIESSIIKYGELNPERSGGRGDDNSTFSSLASLSYSLEAVGDHSTTMSSKARS